MMIKKRSLIGMNCLLSLLLFACDESARIMKDLDGKWEAIELSEEGQELPLDSAAVGFQFNVESKRYQFNSTLRYQEAGSFYVQLKYLVTKDTIQKDGQEKNVEIVSINADTLVMKMKEGKKDRLLTLISID
ncbi:MAG: lipocalin family protein [Bacteroidota bacterium]